MKKMFFSIIFSISICYSSDISFFTGLGQEGTPGKILGVNYNHNLDFINPLLRAHFEVGGLNPINYLTNNYSLYGDIGIGFEVINSLFFMKFSQGIGIVSKTTKRLNTHLQYPTTITAGIKNEHGKIGVFWKHFSNGSGSIKNFGNDFLGVSMSLFL